MVLLFMKRLTVTRLKTAWSPQKSLRGLGEEAMLSTLFIPHEFGTCFWPCHITGTETGPDRQSHLPKAQLPSYGICIPDKLSESTALCRSLKHSGVARTGPGRLRSSTAQHLQVLHCATLCSQSCVCLPPPDAGLWLSSLALSPRFSFLVF